MLLQREPFLTMFYTVDSSPMLVTKSVFKLIFVLSNYANVYLPFYIFNCSPSYQNRQESRITLTSTRTLLWLVTCSFYCLLFSV